MYFLYDILLHFSLVILLPYFLFKIVFVGKYRQGIWERLGFINKKKIKNLALNSEPRRGGVTPPLRNHIIWFHAVSVGETKAVLPLLKMFKEKYPDAKIVFSTVTQTGNKVASEQGLAWIDALIYFPLDFRWVVNRTIKKIRPKVFVVVEKEIWPNMLRALEKYGIPVLVVNGAISDRSFHRYKMFGFFLKRIFSNIAYFLSQTRKDGEKAIALGIEPSKVSVTGNIKFDIKPPHWNSHKKDALLKRLNITADGKIIVAGSTHAGEEEIILDVFRKLKQEFSGCKLILAPRHPERFDEVERLILAKGLSAVRRSAIDSSEFGVRSSELKDFIFSSNPPDVILLDTIGELCNFYSIATVALVGGTLVNIGGHNLLEPAFYKKPVLYGSHLKSYTEMADMLEAAGGGIRVNTKEIFLEKMKKLLADEAFRQRVGNAAYSVIEANKGATEKCLKILEGFMREGARNR